MFAMQLTDEGALTPAQMRTSVATNALEQCSWYYGLSLQQKAADQAKLEKASGDYVDYVSANAQHLAHGPSIKQLNYAYDKLKPFRHKLIEIEKSQNIQTPPRVTIRQNPFQPR